MTIRRFFVSPQDFQDDQVVIGGDEHNHLKNVLRLQVGNQIILTCNDEFDYYATIEEIGKSATRAKVTKKVLNECNPKVSVTVFQALTKKDAMSNLVTRLSELGVTTFVPFVSANITAKDKESKTEKLQLIANQSTKQCKRSKALGVEKTISFEGLLKLLKTFDAVVFANELENSVGLRDLNLQNNARIACIVGSEGGFTPQEAQQIVACGGSSVSLGKRILRVETATLAVVSVVMNQVGELG